MKKTVCWSAIGSGSQMLVTPGEFYCFWLKKHFVSCLWELHVEKHIKIIQSNQIWESLPILYQKTFFFDFLHETELTLLCTWWKRYSLNHFQVFFYCFQPCKWMRKLTFVDQIHNKRNTIYHFCKFFRHFL